MKKLSLLITAIMMVFSVPASGLAEMAGPYQWESAYVRETPAKIAAGYVRVINPTTSEDALIAAKSDWAGRIELHTITTSADGVMKMTPVKEIQLHANGAMELAPGGYHLMLFDLKDKLSVNDKKNITLTFQKAGDLVIPFTVQPLATGGVQAKAAPSGMDHHDHHAH